MRLPAPNDLIKLAAQGLDAAERAISMVPRLVVIVGQVEELMTQVRAVVADIEATQRRAAGVVRRTEMIVSRVEGTVGRADALTSRAQPLLDRFQPALERLAPMLDRLAETTSRAEIDAVVKLVDTLPGIADKMDRDIVPILDTLGTVAPDLRDLLDVSKELNEMLGAVPGLGRIKKRIEERQELADEHLADEAPPTSPDRSS